MRKYITSPLYVFLVTSFLLCIFSCSFETQKINTSISIPTKSFSRAITIKDGAEYYIEYEINGATNVTNKIELTLSQLKTQENINFELNDIPLEKYFTIIIELTEYTTVEGNGKNKKILYKGETKTVLTAEKQTIDIIIKPVEDSPIIASLTPIDITGTFNVGDLVLTNGKVIQYNADANFEDYLSYENQAIAVIFKATEGNNKALGVGVKQTYCNWVKNTTVEAYNKDFEGLSNHKDGSITWDMICEADNAASSNMEDYEIFNFAENYPCVYYEFEEDVLTKKTRANYLESDLYNDDWYIPTYTECNDLFNNLDKVNSVLNALGAIKPDSKYTAFYNNSVQLVSQEWYWTSNTESAGKALFYDFGGKKSGYSISRVQDNNNVFYVLAIRKF